MQSLFERVALTIRLTWENWEAAIRSLPVIVANRVFDLFPKPLRIKNTPPEFLPQQRTIQYFIGTRWFAPLRSRRAPKAFHLEPAQRGVRTEELYARNKSAFKPGRTRDGLATHKKVRLSLPSWGYLQ